MAAPLTKKLAAALGANIVKSRALPGGDIADVSLLTLDNHTQVVAKRPRMDQPDTAAVEAKMLKHLKSASQLPVPKVLFQAKNLLVISYIPNKGKTEVELAASSAAKHIASLHKNRPTKAPAYYGFETDTYIGPLPQTNTSSANWCKFFTEQRLLAMAQSCLNVTRFDAAFMSRIEALAKKLPDILPASPDSSLLHGDLWDGNMLFDGDRAVGFIDPAISYGHREMDLAFIDLMGNLGPTFIDAYHEHYPISEGYNEERKAIYQLWPLLVHVRLFGDGYIRSVDTILRQFEL